MKYLLMVMLCSASLSMYAQENFDGHKWEAPYHLPIPKDWTIERFPLPISFAPQIAYKGIEDIRFAPGWAKKKSDEYWSYVFLWWLEGDIKTDATIIENNLKAYYTGLVSINGRNIPAEKIITVETSFRQTGKDNLSVYTGTIRMTDYMSQEPIVLNCKAYIRTCPGENRTFIFYKLSPQPLTHDIWQSLDKIWQNFKCKKD